MNASQILKAILEIIGTGVDAGVITAWIRRWLTRQPRTSGSSQETPQQTKGLEEVTIESLRDERDLLLIFVLSLEERIRTATAIEKIYASNLLVRVFNILLSNRRPGAVEKLRKILTLSETTRITANPTGGQAQNGQKIWDEVKTSMPEQGFKIILGLYFMSQGTGATPRKPIDDDAILCIAGLDALGILKNIPDTSAASLRAILESVRTFLGKNGIRSYEDLQESVASWVEEQERLLAHKKRLSFWGWLPSNKPATMIMYLLMALSSLYMAIKLFTLPPL